jgi:hypothetical protein
MRLLIPLLSPLILVVACADDSGDMTKTEAIKACQAYVRESIPAMEFKSAEATKDDRYWEVSGTTDRGNYRCVVNALDEVVRSGMWDK